MPWYDGKSRVEIRYRSKLTAFLTKVDLKVSVHVLSCPLGPFIFFVVEDKSIVFLVHQARPVNYLSMNQFQDKTIKHVNSGNCLTRPTKEDPSTPLLKPCDYSEGQQWLMQSQFKWQANR